MKRMISAMLCMIMIVAALSFMPAAASADYPEDDWGADFDWNTYEKIYRSLDSTIKAIQAKQSEPVYVCWYDLNNDGYPELIIDDSNGKNAVDTIACKQLTKNGERCFMTKGNCTMYYWDFDRNALIYCPIKNNSMFVSVWPEACCIVSAEEKYGMFETFYYCDMFYKKSPEASSYMLTYNGGKVMKASLSGTGEVEIEGALLDISEMFAAAQPLVFSAYE